MNNVAWVPLGRRVHIAATAEHAATGGTAMGVATSVPVDAGCPNAEASQPTLLVVHGHTIGHVVSEPSALLCWQHRDGRGA